MIRLLVGDNNFEKERALKRIIAASKVEVEKYDGTTLEIKNLPDLLMGATLFASKRLIVIKHLSDNSSVWDSFGNMLDSLSDDIELVLVETKPDKRSSTYKDLAKSSEIVEFNNWDERDFSSAIKWLNQEAKNIGLNLDTKITQQIVDRVGVDQWSLSHALDKLALVDEINSRVVESVIDANPSENVFNLLETAIMGDKSKVSSVLKNLELNEDPARLLSLMSGQAFQLTAIINAAPDDNVASDFGIHPYVVSKLKALSRRLSKTDAKKILNILAEADDNMKISKGDPWLITEIALQKIAELNS